MYYSWSPLFALNFQLWYRENCDLKKHKKGNSEIKFENVLSMKKIQNNLRENK